MSCDIEAARPSGPVYRLARGPDVWRWPDWAFAGPDGTFGNRYDDPQGEYRVLYAGSARLGAFVEALARFRPDPALVAGLDEIDDDGRGDAPVAGVVPSEWLAGRAIGQATLAGEFAAIGRSRSLAYLAGELAAPAARLDVGELDGAAIRMQVPRAFTQLVSRCVYDCRERDGSRQFTGVHYLSRLELTLID